MQIEKVDEITDEIYEGVCRLVPSLGTHKLIPSRAELDALIASESSILLVARTSGGVSLIAGMLTISIYRVPTGIRSIVEDVVVDAEYRGRGIAKALLEAAIDLAREVGASGIALTSNPQRVEANFLYQSVGFSKRETNAYFYKLK
jgi:ribosomal protein S18 acetylase RimI-like enzyme